MAEVKINWTEQAIEDINSIADYIAQDSYKYAVLQVERFFESVKKLQQHPNLGRRVPELNNDLIRELILGNYRIIYFIKSANCIDIVTVHHSRRLLKLEEFK